MKWFRDFLDRFFERSWQRKANKMFLKAQRERNLK